MINPLKLNSSKRQHLSAVLGLTLDGSRLDGVVLRRTNGSVHAQPAFSVTLSLDPLTADPELVGREIRNHLDAAGVREKHCVVGLPLKWALTAHTKLPKLEEADVAGFLQIEAERGFPCDVATLLLGTSLCQTAGGERYATLIGIPRNHITLLEQVLRAAQLKPVSFSLGITEMQRAGTDAADGVLALAIGESHVGLQVTCGGGVAALRALEGALETEGGRRRLVADLVAREARITLGQLPPEFREAVRRVRIFGPRELTQDLAVEIKLRFEPMGLKVELVSSYAPGEFGVQLPIETVVSPAFSLAAGLLGRRGAQFEFLPPKVTAWKQFTAKYSSGKMQMTLTTAGAVAALVAALFLFQQVQLWSLNSQWMKISKTVKDLTAMQDKIKQFRPWNDASIKGLTILKGLTEAFPQDGTVTAKSVEIHELNTITCSGVTRDNPALMATIKRLRAMPQVTDVQIGSLRGQSPAVQFTFVFKWREGGSSAN
jgi:hypothetical protein